MTPGFKVKLMSVKGFVAFPLSLRRVLGLLVDAPLIQENSSIRDMKLRVSVKEPAREVENMITGLLWLP